MLRRFLGAGAAFIFGSSFTASAAAAEALPDADQPQQQQPPPLTPEQRDKALVDLDWDRPIEELAADEACPPCFRSELLGPCGATFAPAYKCFRLCQIQEKDTEICSELFIAYMKCVRDNPQRYAQGGEDEQRNSDDVSRSIAADADVDVSGGSTAAALEARE